MTGPLIDVDELATALQGEEPPAVLDVRWRLGGPDGRVEHASGHVPGAAYVDLDRELAAPPSAAAGRHPLPALADLQASARAWGVRQGQPVVVMDDLGGMSAARGWWLLRWGGVEDVRVLDGGLAAWRDAGLPLVIGEESPAPGDVVLRGGGMPVLDLDGVRTFDGLLLDARAGERYRGEVEPIDPRAGHVPGAVSLPTAGNLDSAGRFLPAAALRNRFAAAEVAPTVAAYCGSGVTAAHEILALEVAGIPAALYAGSWSQWSADPSLPVATGAEPG